MQNMIRVEDSIGVIHVYFDVKDGMITNLSAKDERGDMTFDEDMLKDWCAKEYTASMLEMAIIYKSGMNPLMV